LLGNIKNGLFCLIKEIVCFLPTLKAGLGYGGTLTDQLPSNREVSHDFGMELDAGRGRNRINQRSQIVRAPGLIKQILFGKILGEGNEIDGLIVVIETDHPFKEMHVGFAIEIAGEQGVHDLSQRFVIDQNARQNGLLSLYVVRGDLDL
jgi:hypothetical protein